MSAEKCAKLIESTLESINSEILSQFSKLDKVVDKIPAIQKENGQWCDAWAQLMIRLVADSEYGLEDIDWVG